MSVLALLTDAVLRDQFDPVTRFRGRKYADDGHVGEPRVSATGDDVVEAEAEIAGTAPEPYLTRLTVERTGEGVRLRTRCTCPVGSMCKHSAALAMTLHDHAPSTAGTGWEDQLRTLLGQLAEEARPEAELPGLALEVGVDTGTSAFNRLPSVRIRALRQNARGTWMKTGADWSDLRRATPGKDFPRQQLGPISELAGQLQRERNHGFAGTHAPLDEFGPRVLDLVAQALAGGVQVLPGPGLRSVTLSADPVTVSAEARRLADHSSEVRVGFRTEDELLSGPGVIAIGRPAHGVALLAEGHLRLARLTRPVGSTVLELITAPEPVRAPAADADRLDGLLGPLARLRPVRSPDDSLAVPPPPRPLLTLLITWHGPSRATLAWEWDYAGQRYPLGSARDLGVLRDPTAEAEIRRRVPTDWLECTEVTEAAALDFALETVGELSELPDLEIEERHRPDFRAAQSDPEIRFELAEESPADAGPRRDWLDLQVVVMIEGDPVPLPDLLSALTRGEDHLVLASGLYVPTSHPALAQLRDVVAAAGTLSEHTDADLRIAGEDLGLWAQLDDLGAVPSEATAWVRRALALRDLTEIPTPESHGVTAELRSYQREGFWWLALLHQHGLGGILADDMGLGKTLQVLALVAHTRHQAGEEAELPPFLVVAPTSVVPAWLAEARRHTPGLRLAAVRRRADDVTELAAEADIVVTTYAMLRLEQEQFAAREWGGLILDEAQQIKNHRGKTYAAARRIQARFRLAVTGTPFENRLMELWALLSLTAPGLYPQPRQFRDHVVTPVERDGDDAALQRFRRRLAPFLLRRSKELVADDLPPKQEQVVPIELSAEHQAVYDAHLAKQRQRILHLLDDFDENRVAILSALTRLRQLALDPGLVDPEHDDIGSAKLDLLREHIEEITAEGHQVLVFSQFTRYLNRARDALEDAGIATTYLDGRTKDRDGAIETFRAGEASVFLISLKAGGVGLTLTEADYVYVLDPWWNPAAEAQAVDRAHRIGQRSHVMVYRLVSSSTIEEKVMELKERKADLFTQVVDGGGDGGSAIDATDIRALFES